LARVLLDRLPSHSAKLFAGALRRDNPVSIFNYLQVYAKDRSPGQRPVLQATEPSSAVSSNSARVRSGADHSEVGMRLDLGFHAL